MVNKAFTPIVIVTIALAGLGAEPARLKDAKIRGYVTAVRSLTDFDIEDYRITREESFRLDFDNESPEVSFTLQDIRVGVELEIRGSLDETTGELHARAIRVDLEQFKPQKQTAFVTQSLEGIEKTPDGGWRGQLRADGQTIEISQRTKVVFKPTKRERQTAKQRAKAQGVDDASEFLPLTSLDQVTVGMAMTYDGVRDRSTGVILANRVEFSNNDFEDGEARLWRSIRTSVKTAQLLKPAELSIAQIGKFKLLPDQRVQDYVAAVGRRLVPAYQAASAANDPGHIPFEFHVVIDKNFNAFATPNGIVVVNSGLLTLLENEAQLAAVIGHEIAHATHEHTWRQQQYHKNARLGIAVAGAVASAYGLNGVVNATTLINAAIVNGHQRTLENQADRIGLQYMVAAGYDPREAPAVWKLVARQQGVSATDVFWSNHDNEPTRRSYLMNELKNNYRTLDYTLLTTGAESYSSVRAAVGIALNAKPTIHVKDDNSSRRSIVTPTGVGVALTPATVPEKPAAGRPVDDTDRSEAQPPAVRVASASTPRMVQPGPSGPLSQVGDERHRPLLAFIPPSSRPPLPNVDGLTTDQVRLFLGPPSTTQTLRDKRIAWSYATPSGLQTLYFRPATVTGGQTSAAPIRSKEPETIATGSALPMNACRGIVAAENIRTIVVVMPQTPVFVTAEIRQEAIATFAPETVLSTTATVGAWYLVKFEGVRGPQSGYVHCSDVTPLE
jgi:hypothetical protein